MGTIDTTGSGTIAAAHTAQPVSAANASRTYWLLQNLSSAARLWVGIGSAPSAGTTIGTIQLEPGETIDSYLVPEITQAAIYVLGAAAAEPFTFLEVT